jgi:hypothetical protein
VKHDASGGTSLYSKVRVSDKSTVTSKMVAAAQCEAPKAHVGRDSEIGDPAAGLEREIREARASGDEPLYVVPGATVVAYPGQGQRLQGWEVDGGGLQGPERAVD